MATIVTERAITPRPVLPHSPGRLQEHGSPVRVSCACDAHAKTFRYFAAVPPGDARGSPALRAALSPAVTGKSAAGGTSTAGTAAAAALETGARPVACERVTGATTACAEGLTIISDVSLGSTAESAVAPGSETLRLI